MVESESESNTGSKATFMLLYRFPVGGATESASPEEMQAQYVAWTAWMEKFAGELIPGGPLKPGGAVVRGGAVTDGPYIEAKEVLASYAMIETTSLDRALEIVKACPIGDDPAYSVEIRELGY